MESKTIYMIIGVLFSIYIVISMMNRRKAKKRNSRKFMDDYNRNDDKKEN